MKKKELFILVISIFISINTFAISDYKIGDTLNVWAKKGLQLRSDPSFTSDPITLIDYGEYIETLDKKSIYQGYHRLGELSVIEINSKTVNDRQYPEIRLNGQWCKIKYKDKVGYVFDGYLSKFKPFNYGEDNRKYLDRNFLVIDTIQVANLTSQEWHSFKAVYSNGISYFRSQSTSSGSETIILPYSIEEAYLVFVNRFVDDDYSDITVVEADNNYMFFAIDFSEIKIRKTKGFVIIENVWGN
jgi:hypothetical protein